SESSIEIQEVSPEDVIHDDSSQYLMMGRMLSQGPMYSSIKGSWKCKGGPDTLQGNQGCTGKVADPHQETLPRHVSICAVERPYGC
ncbi:Hypothetical predicted protein, partial [Marmota monax]